MAINLKDVNNTEYRDIMTVCVEEPSVQRALPNLKQETIKACYLPMSNQQYTAPKDKSDGMGGYRALATLLDGVEKEAQSEQVRVKMLEHCDRYRLQYYQLLGKAETLEAMYWLERKPSIMNRASFDTFSTAQIAADTFNILLVIITQYGLIPVVPMLTGERRDAPFKPHILVLHKERYYSLVLNEDVEMPLNVSKETFAVVQMLSARIPRYTRYTGTSILLTIFYDSLL